MTTTEIFLVCCILALLVIWAIIGIHLEKKAFNNGVCPYCGDELYLNSYANFGDRGYKCHKCGYHTWVSYNCVDKNFREY